MTHQAMFMRFLALLFCWVILGAAVCEGAAAKLTVEGVRKLAEAHFAGIPGRTSSDIISKSDVAPLLASLKKEGWNSLKPEWTLDRVLADSDPLVKELRTPKGRELIRLSAQSPLVYDRLDRLVRLPGGQQFVHDVAKLPDGVKILSAKPTPGLKNLAQLLPKSGGGQTPQGKDFDKPTGNLYTAKHVVDELAKQFQTTHGRVAGK